MEAIISSLNAAYQVPNSRGWWRERLLAIALTLGLATFVIVSLVIVFFGGAITNAIASRYGFGQGALLFWHIVQWPIAGVFVLRVKRPDMERPYRAFGYPVLPAIYILAAGTIEVLLLLYKPNFTWPGLIIVLLGIPAYYWMRAGRKDAVIPSK